MDYGVIVDVETTGLIKGRNVNVSETHKFPYIVQFSWLVYDTEEGMIIDDKDKVIKIDPNDMHHILSYAHIFIGDSQTMAAEAAILGTPSTSEVNNLT